MAWEARSGLKHPLTMSTDEQPQRLNGLGSPFGIETLLSALPNRVLLQGLNGLGSPFGIETVDGIIAPF